MVDLFNKTMKHFPFVFVYNSVMNYNIVIFQG